MKVNIKNASGKVIGYTEITQSQIIVHNNTKPELIINSIEDINIINSKIITDDFLIHLYDDYLLSCGEIASLFNVCYSNINKRIKKLGVKTTPSQGRRNRSYGHQQNDKTKKNISNGVKKAYQDGKYKDISPYERTPEIREKISNSLKTYYKNNPQNPEPHRKNWEKGVYNKVDFHRGIGGNFFSIKNNRRIYFRSVLELFYMLILENDNNIIAYQYEPFSIKCDNQTLYIPDIQIDNVLIELKSKKYINSNKDIKEKFLYKKEQAEKYCKNNGFVYKIIYDEDIGFDSSRMKRHLKNNPDIIEKYKIYFNDPKRVVIK